MTFGRVSATLARTVAMACVFALALGLVVGIGVYLAQTQAAAKDKLHKDFAKSARAAADLTGSVLAASDAAARAEAQADFAGTATQVKAAITKAHDDDERLIVLRADGTVVAADVGLASAAERLGDDRGFAMAVRTGALSFSDVVPGSNPLSLHGFQPFTASDGMRVLVLPVSLTQLATLYSTSINDPGGAAYLIDAQSRAITSSNGAAAGEVLADSALVTALGRSGAGSVDSNSYAAAAVSAATWRVVFSTPERTLMAPVQATRRVAWQLFGAFAGAMALLLLIATSAIIGSVRLSHARRHDALTGLPNRSLFIERTSLAIRERRRENGLVAALFIDLDGFKPVNDAYGHAVGDAVLQAVASRLVESIRPGDQLSRFGGDEFLVLCTGLHDKSDARAIADRIQDYIAMPMHVGGRVVLVGASIGIAIVDAQAASAEALIHNADLAMYRAKKTGRGRVEHYSPDMAASGA